MPYIVKDYVPDVITSISNFTPSDVSYLRDNLTSLDANNLVPIDALSTPRVSLYFGEVDDGVMVGTQKVKLVYLDNNWVGLHIEIIEYGVLKYTSPVTYNGYNNIIVEFPFDASILTDPTGGGIVVKVVGHIYAGTTINELKAVRITANIKTGEDALHDARLDDIEEILFINTNWAFNSHYHHDALNRVETISEVTKNKINFFRDNEDIYFETIVNRTSTSIEHADSLRRIENNILTLATSQNNYDYIIPPKLDWTYNTPFSYGDANRLEHNIYVLYRVIQGNIENLKFCGRDYCGIEGAY